MESQLIDRSDAMEVSGNVDLSTYEVQVDQETYEGMLLWSHDFDMELWTKKSDGGLKYKALHPDYDFIMVSASSNNLFRRFPTFKVVNLSSCTLPLELGTSHRFNNIRVHLVAIP